MDKIYHDPSFTIFTEHSRVPVMVRADDETSISKAGTQPSRIATVVDVQVEIKVMAQGLWDEARRVLGAVNIRITR